MRTLAFAVLLSAAFPTYAADCAPLRYSASEIAAWEIVFAGQVTGARYPAYEADVLREGAAAKLAPDAERTVRVAVTDAYRGTPQPFVDAAAYPCGKDAPAIGERVVVYGTATGVLYTAPASGIEDGLRELFAPPSE